MEFIKLFLCVILFFEIEAASITYSYNNFGADWTTGSCQSGTSQSPINLDHNTASVDTGISPFNFINYGRINKYSVIKNNGHTVQVDMADDTVKLNGGGLDSGDYVLAQFHFHWGENSLTGSEHNIDNKMYPLEVHFVHWKESIGDFGTAAGTNNGLAVLGFMFELSPIDNINLNFFIDQISDVQNLNTNGVPLTVQSAPDAIINGVDKTKFFRYSGSLTTPGCNEVVQWTVFTETIKISESQMTKIRSTFQDAGGATVIGYNYRPIQPIGSRTVKISFQPEVSGSSQLYYSSLLTVIAVVLYRVL